MFKSVRVSNFHSIGEVQELSMEINSKDILDDSARKLESGALNLVSCVIGANASGKTTILKAITFIFWFVNAAYTSLKSEEKIPCTPHRLTETQPTKITLQFLNDKLWYEYEIEFNTTEILRERLEKEGLRSPVFKIDRKTNIATIETHTTLKLNETDKERFKERKNVPLLSSLIDTGYLPEINFFKKFNANVNRFGNLHSGNFIDISRELHGNEFLQKEVLSFSKDLDLGLSGFQFGEAQRVNEKDPTQIEKTPVLECIHQVKNKKFSLPFFLESNGTQHFVFLYLKILPILNKGGVIILDEIEYGLHMDAVKKIISLFESKQTNPHGAQLIFSTHQLPLLNDRTKTQIFIAEKNEVLETEVYRLDDLDGIRNDENYFHKYIAGAYGGTPNINWLGDGKNG